MLCKLSDGKSCNVEVQMADDDDHFRRVRYHASCITANITDTGIKFRDVPNVCVIYITTFDILNRGKTIYHSHQYDEESHTLIHDGLDYIYVNTEVDDGTMISRLMQCFMQTEVDESEFPNLTRGVNHLKNNKEGVNTMCQVWEKYNEEIKAAGKAEGRAEGIIKMGREFNLNSDRIIQKIMEETPYTMNKAKELLLKYDSENK